MTTKQKLWSERITAWRASGKTAEEFRHGSEFTAQQLRYWAYVLRQRAAKEAAAPEAKSAMRIARVVRNKVARAEKKAGGGAEAGASALMLEMGSVRIAVRRGFDRETLASVLEVLKAGGHR